MKNDTDATAMKLVEYGLNEFSLIAELWADEDSADGAPVIVVWVHGGSQEVAPAYNYALPHLFDHFRSNQVGSYVDMEISEGEVPTEPLDKIIDFMAAEVERLKSFRELVVEKNKTGEWGSWLPKD